MKTILVVLVCVVVLGCGEDGATPISSVLAGGGEGATRAEQAGVAASASMESHYSVVVLAQDALVLGDVERFGSLLAIVADQPLSDGIPPHWRPFYVQLKAAARQGAGVADLDAAASAFAHVVLSCGSCHGALGMGPMESVYPARPRAENDVVEAAMRDHGWASQRLWEGIIGPQNDAWKRGARALATQEVFARIQRVSYVSSAKRQAARDPRPNGRPSTAGWPRAAQAVMG